MFLDLRNLNLNSVSGFGGVVGVAGRQCRRWWGLWISTALIASDAVGAFTLLLEHGDIMIMHGAKIQKLYEVCGF